MEVIVYLKGDRDWIKGESKEKYRYREFKCKDFKVKLLIYFVKILKEINVGGCLWDNGRREVESWS